MKWVFTAWVIVIDFLLLVGPIRYFRNKKEFDRRYWGKNKTWLHENTTMQIVKAILLALFIVGIWLSK